MIMADGLNPSQSCLLTAPILTFNGGRLNFTIQNGASYIIVGANGAGKTRLGVLLESQIPADAVQRIAAQKSLSLRDDLSIISFERAGRLLRIGSEGNFNEIQVRWGNKPSHSVC